MRTMRLMKEDLAAAMAKDPAARSRWEVALLYTTLHAVWAHRIAHALWRRRLRFLARMIMGCVRTLTSIEIHPAASIGRRFFIDHGEGVVIGETTEIGDDVLLYQGVTLGGTRLERTKRHPTLGRGVVVGAGAKVLGPIHLGEGARIGANSVVIRDVPPWAVMVGIPARQVERRQDPRVRLRHDLMGDPLEQSLQRMEDRLRVLEHRLAGEGSEATNNEDFNI